MNINDLDLDRGFFQLTLPYRWQYWIGWVFGMLMVLVGAVVNPLIALFGLLVVALCSPGSLEADLHKVRKAAPTRTMSIPKTQPTQYCHRYGNVSWKKPRSRSKSLMFIISPVDVGLRVYLIIGREKYRSICNLHRGNDHQHP